MDPTTATPGASTGTSPVASNPSASGASSGATNGKTNPASPSAANPAAEVRPDQQRLRTDDAARLAALARRERHVQTQREHARREIESRAAALKAEQQSLAKEREELAALRAAREMAKSDPLKALEALGLNYDAVAEAQLNGGKIPPEKLAAIEASRVEERVKAEVAKQEAEIKKLREEQESLRKQREDEASSAAESRMQAFRQDTAAYVQSQKEKYQLVTALGREAEVAQLIEQAHAQSYQQDVAAAKREGREPTGRVLTVDEAAGLIESWYEEQFEKAYSTPKLAAKYRKLEQPAPANATAGEATQGAAATSGNNDATRSPDGKEVVKFNTRDGGVRFERIVPGQRPTLTNQIASTPSTPLPEGPLSEAERMNRARAAMDRAAAERRARATNA